MEIATSIIDSIDEDGYLKSPMEEILSGLNKEYEVEMDEVEAVLHRIQQFDPPGVGARDLQECLYLQLNQIEADTLWIDQAKLLVKHHLDLLAAHDYNQLMRKMHISQPELVQIIGLVTALNPHIGYDNAAKIAKKAHREGKRRCQLTFHATPPKAMSDFNFAHLREHTTAAS
jgi:RNA polymerase sigma-54 factor